MTARYAAVDCGTNSIRLLVAEPDGRGGLVELDRRLEMVRLGQGVDATGELHPDALARTLAACDRFAEVLRGFDVPAQRLRFVATSAVRDVTDAGVLVDGVRDRLGVVPEVLSGAEEAELSFAGALSGLPAAEEPVLVVDVGGGSTELVLGQGGRLLASVSLDVGAVRLRERLLRGDPPSQAELLATQEHVDEQLDGCDVPLEQARSWVGVAGTMTSLSALHQGLPVYDRAAVHGSSIPRADLMALCTSLVQRPVHHLRDLPSMHPLRADVISGGCVVVERIAQRLRVPALTVSESDILDGVVLDRLEQEVRR